jgi:hypothetical protein
MLISKHFNLIIRALSVEIVLLALSSQISADGGLIAIHQLAGPFEVTVFTSGFLRAGPADISVLVQDRTTSQPVLDGEVFIELQRDGRIDLSERATRGSAQNKLLYSALMVLPEAGGWELEVTVRRGEETASVRKAVVVEEPAPFLLAYWRSLSVPPIVIAVFVLNQWLKRRGGRRHNTGYRQSDIAIRSPL